MKKILIAGVAVLALAAGGGWFYAQGEAQSRFDEALADVGYGEIVQYGDLSYNPLAGTLEVTDIRLTGDTLGPAQHLNARVDRLTVLDYASDAEGIIETLDLKLTGVSLNIAEAATAVADNAQSFEEQRLSNMLRTVAEFGYPVITGGIDMIYDYDRDAGTMSETVTIAVDNAGALEYGVDLSDISYDAATKLDALGKRFNMANRPDVGEMDAYLEEMVEALGETSFVSSKIAFTEGGLVEKLWGKFDEMTGREPGAPRDDALFMPIVLDPEMVAQKIDNPARVDEVLAGNQALIDFLKQPDELVLTISADEGVSITEFLEAAQGNDHVKIKSMVEGMRFELKS